MYFSNIFMNQKSEIKNNHSYRTSHGTNISSYDGTCKGTVFQQKRVAMGILYFFQGRGKKVLDTNL